MIDADNGSVNWRGLSVLVVSPTPTHPQDHGNRKRIFEICSALKRQGAEIHFIYYAAEMDWRDRRPVHWEREMEAAWDSFHLVLPSRPLHESAMGEDHLIDEWQDAALAGAVRWFCSVRRYDAVIVNYTWLSFCFNHVPAGTFKILDTHDVFSDRRAMLEKNGIAAEFFHTTRQEEAKAIARAHMVWAIKPTEREFFVKELGAKWCLTMLHAEPDKNWWRGDASKDGWLRAGVIGARNNVNRRNLEMFLEAALPVFEDYMAPVKIVIAGSCADDFEGVDDPNVEIMGRVEEVEDFYRNMDIIIAPMQFSTGLKIKVSEALASGVPLIAHAHATEGYPVTDSMHGLDSFEAIARELALLSFDQARLPALAEASKTASLEIQRDVLRMIERTRRGVVDFMKPAACIVAPLGALNREAPLFDLFLDAFEHLRAAKTTAVYLTGEARKFDPELIYAARNMPAVFVAPDLAGALGAALPESWKSMELADVLQARAVDNVYFLCSVSELSAHNCSGLKQASICTQAFELGGEVFSPLVDILRPVTETALIAANANAPVKSAGPWSAHARKSFSRVARRRKFKLGSDGILVLGNEKDLLVPVLRDLSTRLGFPMAVLDPASPDVSAGIASSENSAPEDAIDVAGMRLVVDLTQSQLSAAIAETAMRNDIPIIKCPRGMADVVWHNERGDIHAVTIAGFLRSVARGLTDSVYRQKLCGKTDDEIFFHEQGEGANRSDFGQTDRRSAAGHLFGDGP